jgi:hypothetical protein
MATLDAATRQQLRARAMAAPVSHWRVQRRGSLCIVETEVPCINGLTAWFEVAHVDDPDEAEMGYSDGAIGSADDRAAYIAAANPQVVLALLGRVEALEAALRPFATAADVVERSAKRVADDTGLWTHHNNITGDIAITVGDCRAARLALLDALDAREGES